MLLKIQKKKTTIQKKHQIRIEDLITLIIFVL